MDADLWSTFPRDPRERAHAGLRASDDDRERITAVLTTAYADGRLEREELDQRVEATTSARTLGELLPLVSDLVPVRPVARPTRSLVGVSPEQLHDRAVERWRDQRRGAAYLFLGSTILAWGVVAVAGWGSAWLLIVNALALLHLGRVLLAREQIVREQLRRLEKRQARQQLLRQRLPRALPWEQ